jgi:pimeloyl-ACP methyl ester carboxylesterase
MISDNVALRGSRYYPHLRQDRFESIPHSSFGRRGPFDPWFKQQKLRRIQMSGIKNIVLVHGAWADGSSWSKLIPFLQAKGLHVAAVQNPLSSIADDVASTNRLINAQDGPVLLVGHSYGGAVISEAGMNHKVAGLVYVAALRPTRARH